MNDILLVPLLELHRAKSSVTPMAAGHDSGAIHVAAWER